MPNKCAQLSLTQTLALIGTKLWSSENIEFASQIQTEHFSVFCFLLWGYDGKNSGNDPIQCLMILAANWWLISRVLYYLSLPSSKVISGRACIIQCKSGLRLLSYESGLMWLMWLPHHFPHRSRRSLSSRRVKCCKHSGSGVISFYISGIHFNIPGQNLWGSAVPPNQK